MNAPYRGGALRWALTLMMACAAPMLFADEGLVDPGDMPGPLSEVSFEQKLGDYLPLETPFVDETGQAVKLGDYFGERPVVLTFVY